MKQNYSNVSIDAHPIDVAVVVRYQIEGDVLGGKEGGTCQQVINLKDLSEEVDISSLASLVISKCPIIPPSSRQELEQVLFYLQKRLKSSNGRIGSAASSTTDNESLSSTSTPIPPVQADIDDLESILELFYEGIPQKNQAVKCILELSEQSSNLLVLVENETLIGALARVFREDWKKNFELAINIANVFVRFSYYLQFQAVITHHKVGALCISTIDHELKRGEVWAKEAASADERTARKCKLAIRKQNTLMSSCITILTNLAVDLSVEWKMVRKDVVSLLLKCLQIRSNECDDVITATVQFLLKLSIFQENKALLESPSVIDRLLSLFPIEDGELRKAVLRLLFNLSFDVRSRARMVAGGLVAHVAPLIATDTKAMNLLYQLSINDDAKAMITYTDAIQLLMRDLLSGTGSDVTKAILLNACVEKRNAQLVCGPSGQGLDLLMETALDSGDLLVAKIIRSIATHDGPTQDMFIKWMPRLISISLTESVESAEERAALGLECIGTAALIRNADWTKICSEHDLVSWMGTQLRSTLKEREPLQLQIVIMCGTMARQLEAARGLVPLLDIFLNLLHTLQVDDEFVVQLLFLFLQLLLHKELSDRLMCPQSALGAYVIDLMHDKNTAIREQCENALIIIGEHSQEWARRIAAERFRWHNEQWLSMVEGGHGLDDGTSQVEDDYRADVLFDDQYDDGFDLATEEQVF